MESGVDGMCGPEVLELWQDDWPRAGDPCGAAVELTGVDRLYRGG